MLNRDQILKADDLARSTIAVPEWGGDVIVRAMTGLERAKWNAAQLDYHKGKAYPTDLAARVVSWCAIDERGERLFSDKDVSALALKSASAIERLYDEVWKLSGLGAAGVETAKGNSDAIPSDG